MGKTFKDQRKYDNKQRRRNEEDTIKGERKREARRFHDDDILDEDDPYSYLDYDDYE